MLSARTSTFFTDLEIALPLGRQIVNRLQQLGQETINWIVEAKWQSQLMGTCSLWDWDNPQILLPLFTILGEYQAFNRALLNSSASSDSNLSASSLPTDSIISIPPSSAPNSPFYALLPFRPLKGHLTKNEGNIKVLLQVVLHPTVSRYTLKYPAANLFSRILLINTLKVVTKQLKPLPKTLASTCLISTSLSLSISFYNLLLYSRTIVV
jgi:hypothetical protein